MTIQDIKDKGFLLYEYIRGSQSQGLATPESDIDLGGVFIAPEEDVIGTGIHYQDQVSNETNDEVYYEIGKLMKLLCNSNPTVLEALFIDDEFVLYEHPVITEIKKHKEKFLTKACFKPFFGYAKSQIEKAQGLNKLMNINEIEKKGPLDFCYTFYNQGSTKLINWLDNHGLNQKYCGLVSVPNMHNMYGVYYDWGSHLRDVFGWCNTNDDWVTTFIGIAQEGAEGLRVRYDSRALFARALGDHLQKHNWPWHQDENWLRNFLKIYGYSGIVAEDGSSNTLRYIQDNYTEKDGVMLNSVAKGQEPICYMSFNADGYAKHLRDYARYQKWLKERNPVRYENNKGHNYDAKNFCQCFRLVNTAIEIAKGETMHVNRSGIDRDFLLAVKHHEYSYEELMEMLKKKEEEMKLAAENCTLPESVDEDMVNEILISIRKKFYNKVDKA